jgi:hypothetical protein
MEREMRQNYKDMTFEQAIRALARKDKGFMIYLLGRAIEEAVKDTFIVGSNLPRKVAEFSGVKK